MTVSDPTLDVGGFANVQNSLGSVKEAQRILDRFITVPFEQCHPLSRDFETVPTRTGIYSCAWGELLRSWIPFSCEL